MKKLGLTGWRPVERKVIGFTINYGKTRAWRKCWAMGYPAPKRRENFFISFMRKKGSNKRELPAERVSYIPTESAVLQGLAQVNQDVVRELGRRCPEQKIATLDVDATLIESWKREAKLTYEGYTGYQPRLALWAEMNVVVGDEFRDGNVPAQHALLPITQRAFQALPETVEERYFRGDSACHEQSLIEWLRDEQRVEGPPC